MASVNCFAQEDTLKQLVVTTTIVPAPAYKVIKVENIESYATDNLADLLSKQTPTYIKSSGPGGLSTISIRGAGASHTQLYWNGISINSPTLGQLDLATLPVAFIDHADIHLGASSVVDGSGGLGGAIQLNTSANYKNKLNATFSKELGSFGIDKTLFSINMGNKKFQSKTSLFRNSSSNNFKYIDITQENSPISERENAEIIQYGLKQEFYFTPNRENHFAVKANYLDSYRQISSAIGIESKGDHQTDEVLRLMGEWRHGKKKTFQHLRFAFIKDELNYIDTSIAINSLISVDSYKASYNFNHYFNYLLKISAQVNAGTDIANSTGIGSQQERNRQSVFLQFEQKSNWGYQYNIAVRQEVINGELTPIIPTIGVKYFLTKNHHFAINANAARNYKAPSLNELYWNPGGNPDLLSEIGFTSEMGLTYQYRKLYFGVSPYYSLIDNWIQWLPQENGIWTPINVKQVENKGIEINIKKVFKISNKAKLNLHSGYNYVNSINKSSILTSDNSIGRQLIYVPKHTFNIVMKLELKKWSFAYNQTVTGKVFIDATNTTYMPYYAPADISISYSLKKGMKSTDIGIKISNLYNEDYQIMANRPLPGRWFLLFLKVNLNATNE
jgi:iron complex outermembrane receptor protein